MGSILFKVGLITLLVGFVLFLAWDDYRSRKAREAEEKAAALTGPQREDADRKDADRKDADRRDSSAD
jgi:hypothetical protein